MQIVKIRVLVEREEDFWLAQCIEHDLATQANTVNELYYEIELMISAHMAACKEVGIEPFRVPPAPVDVLERFERAGLRVESNTRFIHVFALDGYSPVLEVRLLD